MVQTADANTLLFFLGILFSIASLSALGVLHTLALYIDGWHIPQVLIPTIAGLMSSFIGSITVVMGMIQMYDFVQDHHFWLLLAYVAGLGGSILSIGSTSGIALMSSENVSFSWYLKKGTLPALLGYFAGLGVYLGLRQFFN